MIQKSARLQYALLALVALLGAIHAGWGIVRSYTNLAHGTEQVELPVYSGPSAHLLTLSPAQASAAHLPDGSPVLTLTLTTDVANRAGLHVGDAIYTVDGQPYTSTNVLLRALAERHPGDAVPVTFWRSGTPLSTPPISTSIVLDSIRHAPPPIWAWWIQLCFTILPVLCLVTGWYVVFARPRSPSAWMVLGVLGYISGLILHGTPQYSILLPIQSLWETLAQTAMPVSFMLLGIYFPQRARIDVRLPWLKWVLLIPTLVLLPADLVDGVFGPYSFRFLAPLHLSIGKTNLYTVINTVENIIAAIQIGFAFVCLYAKLHDPATTPDARRRLRVLTIGCSVGLVPFFFLLAIALATGTDLGSSVPEWVALSVFATLFVFPLTLAYVVIVQRAMDVRILVRQGTKYFFARQSIFIIGLVLACWMSYELTLAISNHGHRGPLDVTRLFAIIAVFFLFRRTGAKRLQLWIDQKFFREAYSTEQLLAEISDEARNFTETAPLLETISQRLSETLHIDRIAVFLRSGDVFQLQFATGVPLTPGFYPMLADTSTTITTLARGKSAPANVYRDDPTSWLVDATDAERTALADLSTELLVPLPGRNRLVGVIALGPKSSEEPYSKTDRQLLQTIASQTGLALENAELLANLTVELEQRASINREIEIAREVQERLFPQSYPTLEGIDLAGYCRPARYVGGDYYDFFLIPQPGEGPASRLAIAIGDISGKGIPAALLMASLRASLRSVATLQQPDGAGRQDLATLMQHVNRLVYEASSSNRYATFFYAELDLATRLLTYVNAGHNCPAVLRGGEVIQLQPTGTVIGLLQEAEYDQAAIQLEPGDTLLAFTDGISEAMTADDEEWGEDRMIATAQELLAQAACNYSAQQLLDCILARADAFTAGAPQHDDMTLLLCTLV